MKNLNSNQAIGIFDSGIGGLTVAHAIAHELPKENLIYFGDTAHLPYGDKSKAAIQAYSIKIAHFLLQQQCKVVLIACNSASAAAYELVKEYVGSQAIVMNVIDPLIHYLREHYAGQKIGLIGTKQTVNSNIYREKIESLQKNIILQSHATPLLASAIEEGARPKIINALLEEYLAAPSLHNIDALILACTHYPVILEQISNYFQNSIPIIDGSKIVAQALKAQLEIYQLQNKTGQGNKHFFISDYTESFAQSARLFFQEDIKLEHYPLWD